MSVPQPALHYKIRGGKGGQTPPGTCCSMPELRHAETTRHSTACFGSAGCFSVLCCSPYRVFPFRAGCGRGKRDTSDSMTGRDPARRSFCLSQNRKSHPCVCPGRPLPDPPGRTSILPLLHPFYTILSIPLYRLPCASFCLAMPSGFVGRKGLSSCLNRPD